MESFDDKLIGRSVRAKEAKPPYVSPRRKLNISLVDSDCKYLKIYTGTALRFAWNETLVFFTVYTFFSRPPDESDAETENELSEDEDGGNAALEELNRKQQHPDRLHLELWYNEKGEVRKMFCAFVTRKQPE